MSNETKRDVFEDALRALEEFGEQGSSWEMAYDDLSTRYYAASDDALSDNLPVIPKAVSEYIKWGKKYDIQLYMMYYCQLIHRPGFKKLTDDAISWIISSSNIFARVWVLGAWRVEETGEIVKLEGMNNGQ